MPDPITAIAMKATPTPPDAQGAARSRADDPLWQAAVAFEASFLAEMFSHAGAATPLQSDSGLGGGFGEEVYRSMLSREWADNLAQSGGVGLADSIYRSIKLQEGE